MTVVIREELAPVLDWYQSGEVPGRNTADIVRDVVADLQMDRAAILQVQKIAQDAVRMCDEGHPVSARNVAVQVLKIIKGEGQG